MTMTRTGHIDPITLQGFAARGLGSCVRLGMWGSPNSSPARAGAAATT